jgi:hypothetical protein
VGTASFILVASTKDSWLRQTEKRFSANGITSIDVKVVPLTSVVPVYSDPNNWTVAVLHVTYYRIVLVIEAEDEYQ